MKAQRGSATTGWIAGPSDTRLGWQLTDRWQVDLVGQNLFDNSHREFGPITEPYAINIGRSFYGKLTWRP